MTDVPAETRTQKLPDTIVKRYRYINPLCETCRFMWREYYISLNEFGNEVSINISESRKGAEQKYNG